MSSHQEKVRVCDQCDRRVVEKEISYGGSVFDGWFYVEETSGSTQVRSMLQKRQWDFCGSACLLRFATYKLKSK